MRRKPIDIEHFLRWAYREELPKKDLSRDMSPMFAFADLGGRVDVSHEPGFPAAMGEAHGDALKVRDAVERLPEVSITWQEHRKHILPDLWRWVEADDPIISRMQFSPQNILTFYARLGTRPAWDMGSTKVLRVNAANGKPRVQYIDQNGEVMFGLTPGGRYGNLAHCPLRLDPDARDVARARAEYWVWHAALVEVKTIMEGWNLIEYAPTMPVAAQRPWVYDHEPKSRILPSNLPAQAFA